MTFKNSLFALVVAITFAVSGCAKEEGAMEKMGKSLDEAADSAAKSAEDAAEDMKDAMEE